MINLYPSPPLTVSSSAKKVAPMKIKFLCAAFVCSLSLGVSGQEVKPPVTDAETRLEWYKQHMELRETSPYKNLLWRHIGPTHMSGRVTDIAKPLDQPHSFYVASASGGVWKTENRGTTWKPIFDDAPSGSVGAIAVDPSNSDIVWVGLGESNILRSSMAGTGVYRSNDAGKTWTHCGLPDSHHIARIIVHPSDSKTVFVAVGGHEYSENENRGIYKTTDGGESWKKVLYENQLTGANDLAIDPSDPNVLYATMWYRIRRAWSDPVPGPGGGVYKSTDGGDTWNRLTEGLPPQDKCGRAGIAISKKDPKTVYALIDSHEVARKAREGERDAYGRQRKDVVRGAVVYRSNDAGKTWKQSSKNNRSMQRLFSTYGWFFSQIRVDPNDTETVYILGIPLMKSTDGGKAFKPLAYSKLHGDHHALWIDPADSSHLISGNDGGINISYDGGTTWQDLGNLPIVQFYNVAVDNAKPFNVYGSVQDNMSWKGPSNHRPGFNEEINWKRIPGGEASYIQLDPDDENTLYSESFYGAIMRSDLSNGRTKNIKPRPESDEPRLRGQWLAPFQLSEHDSKVVYHGMQYVYRSKNRGDDWERISPDLTNNDEDKQGNISFATITSLSESPVKFGLLYAGTDDGRLHVTRDEGKNWKEILDGLPTDKWISRVVASRYDEATVYVTQNGKREDDFQVYVYRSTDYGDSWTDISAGIPGGPINVIKEDPNQAGVLYVGSDMGVYVSTDNGKSWNILGSRLPNTFVHDLVVHPRDKKLVIATHGRGMFVIKVDSIEADNSDNDTGTDLKN